jgi:hypothetical protein
MMQEAEDEPLFAERAAGIDIAKAGVEVTIRVPSETRRGGRQQETRSFRTHPQGPAGPGGLAAVLGRDQDRDGIDRDYPGFSRSTIAFPQVGLSRTRPRREGQKRQRRGVVAR